MSRAAPRLLALLWAVYSTSRALAYVDSSPPQLAAVADLVPLWIPWSAAAVLLMLGGLVPSRAGTRSQCGARLMRQYGMTISSALLLVWGTAFILSDFHRGWVTASSYLMLVAFSGWSGWLASRDVADVRAVREEGASVGLDQ